jgi:hypothetical protein
VGLGIASPLIFYAPVLSAYRFLSLYMSMLILAWILWAGYVHIVNYSDVYIGTPEKVKSTAAQLVSVIESR